MVISIEIGAVGTESSSVALALRALDWLLGAFLTNHFSRYLSHYVAMIDSNVRVDVNCSSLIG